MGRLSKKIKLQEGIIKRLTKNSNGSSLEGCQSTTDGPSLLKYDEESFTSEENTDTVSYSEIKLMFCINF